MALVPIVASVAPIVNASRGRPQPTPWAESLTTSCADERRKTRTRRANGDLPASAPVASDPMWVSENELTFDDPLPNLRFHHARRVGPDEILDAEEVQQE